MATNNSLNYPDYESIVKLYTQEIHSMFGRTGGDIRGKKAKITEKLFEAIVYLAWHETGGESNQINIIGKRKVPVPIEKNYVKNLTPEATQNHVRQDIDKYIYELELDKVIEIDDQLVLAIECKAYTESTMLRRTLRDFELASISNPNLLFSLFQLENALGGDYGNPTKSEYLGSKPAHTLMSHSPRVKLEIITLVNGYRNSKKPIHVKAHFKELPIENVEACTKKFSTLLKPFV